MSQRRAAWNLVIQAGPPLLGIAVLALAAGARRAPRLAFATATVLCGVGFALFFLAKASLFRRQRWFSFGSRDVTPRHRLTYRIGYALMVVGCVVAAGLIVAWR